MGGFAGPLSRLPEDYSKRSRKHDHGAASPRLQCMRRAVSTRIYPDRTRPCHDGELVKTRTGMSILDKIVARKKEELESNKKRLPASRLERDRKSVVKGKSVDVRVDLGGSRMIKKKTRT